MIDRLIVFAMTQRIFVFVLIGALIGFGGYALSNLPIEAFPDVQDVQVRVISQSVSYTHLTLPTICSV